MTPFRTPRRAPIRPPTEPLERDDDAVIDAGVAPKETGFVTGLVEAAKDWVQPYGRIGRPKPQLGRHDPFMGAPSTSEDDMLRALTDGEFEQWLEDEGVPANSYISDAYRAVRNAK